MKKEQNSLRGKYSRYVCRFGKIEVSDITLSHGAGIAHEDTHLTVVHISELDNTIPNFALEPEGMWTKFSEVAFGKDIDFKSHPDFSKKY